MALYFGQGAPLEQFGFDSFAKLLMHMDGADASTTFIEENGLTVTRTGGEMDTAYSVFGGASGLFAGSGISVPGANFGLGTGDFVLDVRVRSAAFSSWCNFMSFRNGQSSGIWFGLDVNRPVMHRDGGNKIIGDVLSTNTWYHIALIRSSGVDRMFVNGSQVGSDFADTNNYGAPTTFTMSSDAAGNLWMDEARVSIGTDRGWFSGFTPPTAPYGAWSPLSLPNLLAWYDATNGVTGANPITQWNDLSGHGYHLSVITGTPILNATGMNGRPTVEMDNGDYLTTTGNPLVTAGSSVLSCFSVAQVHNNVSSNGRLLSIRASASSDDYNNIYSACALLTRSTGDPVTFGSYQNGDKSTYSIAAATNFRLGCIYDTTPQITGYKNNVAQTPSGITTLDLGGPTTDQCELRIGAGLEGSPGTWDGFCSEMVVCGAALSTEQRATLDAYFVSKWGF